jgi:hypothetical protein
MEDIAKILRSRKLSRDYRCSHEFQAYGNRLADELGDKKHRSLYIKLAKTELRSILDEARASVLDSRDAKTRGRLFMWKIGQIKKERLEKADKKEKSKSVSLNTLPQ